MGRVSGSACVCALRCPPSLRPPHLPNTRRETSGAREEEKKQKPTRRKKGIQKIERNKLQLMAAAVMCGSPARFPPSSSLPVGGTGKFRAATVRKCCPSSCAGVVAVKRGKKRNKKTQGNGRFTCMRACLCWRRCPTPLSVPSVSHRETNRRSASCVF